MVTGHVRKTCMTHAKRCMLAPCNLLPFVLTEPIPAPETAEDALMSLMMALGRRMRQRQPGDAIDYSAFPILKLLTHQGPMRLSALAQVLGLDASTVSRHARQLEDKGLLERTERPRRRPRQPGRRLRARQRLPGPGASRPAGT